MNTANKIFRQIVATIIPTIMKNVLFTDIAQNYTFKSAVIYEVIIKIFLWISPILPNSPWILVAIFDITISLVLYIFECGLKPIHPKLRASIEKERSDPKSTLIFVGLVILATCFSIGIFPLHMRAVATGSMLPEISVGDVVFVNKMDVNDLKVGDVIEYQLEDEFVIHRIISKEVVEGVITIITKGDNNKSPDAKEVYAEQIKGKVIFKIRYLGIPTIWMNKLLNSNETVLVETGQ